MSELTPDDKALLDLAREAHEPTESDRGRVRRALLVQLGVGTGLVGTTAATSKAATAVVVTKVLAAVAIAGAIGGTGAAVYHAAKAGPAPSRAHAPALAPTPTLALAPTPALAPAPSQGDLQQPSSTETAPESDDRHPPLLPKSAMRANNSATTHVATPPSQVTSPPPADSPGPALQDPPVTPPEPSTANAAPSPLPPTTLEAETRLIRAGIAALHGGDAARALALFDEHARAFPAGALAEERAAERVIALGALHRCDQARAAAADFLLDHPHSPLSARVREPCGHTSNP